MCPAYFDVSGCAEQPTLSLSHTISPAMKSSTHAHTYVEIFFFLSPASAIDASITPRTWLCVCSCIEWRTRTLGIDDEVKVLLTLTDLCLERHFELASYNCCSAVHCLRPTALCCARGCLVSRTFHLLVFCVLVTVWEHWYVGVSGFEMRMLLQCCCQLSRRESLSVAIILYDCS